MKRLAALALTAGACLTGCTINVTPPTGATTPEHTATTPETTEPTDGPVTDAAFIDAIRTEYPQLSTITNHQIMELVDSTCDALKRGATWDELANITTQTGTLYNDAFTGIMAAGSAIYCPQAGTP